MKPNKYKIIVLTTILLIITVMTFAKPYYISGDCMEPSIMDGQLCFLDKISPHLHPYQIDDIILFKHEGKVWISRIVALGNDTIQITEDNIVINGIALYDIKIQKNWDSWKHGIHALDKPLQIPENHVFVLSDNLSAKHDDSRVFGPISNSSILGVVWVLFRQ